MGQTEKEEREVDDPEFQEKEGGTLVKLGGVCVWLCVFGGKS